MKKLTWIIQFFIILTITISPISASHATDNVSDMFTENGENTELNQEEQTEENNQNSDIVSDDGSLILDLIKMVFMLGIVLGLIYFLLKFLQKRNKMFQQTRSLENLGGISLGSNKSIQMVKIGSKIFVVGVGENVQLLTEIEDEQLLEELMNQGDKPSPMNQTFQSFMKQWKRKGEESKDKDNQNRSFKQLFHKELTSMKQERTQLIDQFRNRKEDQDG